MAASPSYIMEKGRLHPVAFGGKDERGLDLAHFFCIESPGTDCQESCNDIMHKITNIETITLKTQLYNV